MLIGIHAKLLYLLDLNDGRIRNRLRLSQRRILDCDWRDDNDFNHTESLTQTMGRAAYNKGFEGLIVPSQANQPNGTNLVIFCDKLLRPNSLTPETP